MKNNNTTELIFIIDRSGFLRRRKCKGKRPNRKRMAKKSGY